MGAFLDRRIGFTAIAELIEEALERAPGGDLGSIEFCVATDAATRRFVQGAIEKRSGRPA